MNIFISHNKKTQTLSFLIRIRLYKCIYFFLVEYTFITSFVISQVLTYLTFYSQAILFDKMSCGSKQSLKVPF